MKIYEVRVGFNKKVNIYGNTEYTPILEYYVDKAKAEARYKDGEYIEEETEIINYIGKMEYRSYLPIEFYEKRKAEDENERCKVNKVKRLKNANTIREIEVIE